LPNFEHSVVFELDSPLALKRSIGDIWGPRRWCSVKMSNYNDDPAQGALDGGLSEIRVNESYPLFVSVRSSLKKLCEVEGGGGCG
jgi:hypothetical protein